MVEYHIENDMLYTIPIPQQQVTSFHPKTYQMTLNYNRPKENYAVQLHSMSYTNLFIYLFI